MFSSESQRPDHAPKESVPVTGINLSGFQERLRGATVLNLSAVSIQGARDAESAISAARLLRDFCETDRARKVRLLVCSGLPLSQQPLSTLDRQVIDILTSTEGAGQLEVCFEGASRILRSSSLRVAPDLT